LPTDAEDELTEEADMTSPDVIRACHQRCLPHLATLRLLAHAEATATLSPGASQQVAGVTGLILAETEAAGHAVVAALKGERRAAAAGRFLAARLARMTRAADDALRAAERGDAGTLRRQLRRFDTLTSATWTVQMALHPLPRGHQPGPDSTPHIPAWSR
jgi:hypothetical protein